MRDGGAAASRNSKLERLVDDKTRQKEAEGGRDFLINNSSSILYT